MRSGDHVDIDPGLRADCLDFRPDARLVRVLDFRLYVRLGGPAREG